MTAATRRWRVLIAAGIAFAPVLPRRRGRTVTLIVPWGAGTDVTARIIGDLLEKELRGRTGTSAPS